MIKRIGVFVICAQILIHFRPNDTYEKYFKLLVEIMILLQIFLPIGNLLSGEAATDIEERTAWYEEQMADSFQDLIREYEDIISERGKEQNAEIDASGSDE